MTGAVALKAFVIVAALGVGAAAVTLAVGIQREPRMLTRTQPMRSAASRVFPADLAKFTATLPVTRVTLAPPAQGASTPTAQRVVVQVPVRKVVARSSFSPPPEEDPGADEDRPHVIAAPCNNGEYRKLDDQQGVRISCPGPQ